MKAITILLLLFALPTAFGCSDRDNLTLPSHEQEIGMSFLQGKGLEISPVTRKAIGLETEAVAEGTIEPTLLKSGTVLDRNAQDLAAGRHAPATDGTLVSVPLTSEEAAEIRPGQAVRIENHQTAGRVLSVEEWKPSARTPSLLAVENHEALLEFPGLPAGELPNPVKVTFDLPAAPASALVPKSAVFETVHGKFVYVPNGKYFFRTAVTTGRTDAQTVEIVEGLYAGDEVVSRPVTTLWVAELHATKGGVSCADGH